MTLSDRPYPHSIPSIARTFVPALVLEDVLQSGWYVVNTCMTKAVTRFLINFRAIAFLYV